MLLAVDLGLDKAFLLEEYLKELPLPPDIRRIEEIEDAGPLEEDRVVYITSLNDGGLKYQRDFLRDHPAVREWFVFSDGTPEYLLNQFRSGVVGTKGRVFLSSSLEELKRALARPCLRPKSCLLCTCDSGVDARGLGALLQRDLPDWTMEYANLDDKPDALERNTCAQVLIVGEKRADFLFSAEIPDYIVPILVMTRAERHIHLDSARLRRDAFGGLRSLNWGTEQQRQNFYLVSVFYEGLRRENDGAEALRSDVRFVMWDSFGLPLPVQAYTRESIRSFLKQFDGCARLVARLCRGDNLTERQE